MTGAPVIHSMGHMFSIFGKIGRALEGLLALGERVVVLLAGILEALTALTDIAGTFEFPKTPELPPIDDLRIVELKGRIDDLTNAVGDGILRVQRSENRVRAVVDGARKQLAAEGFEHPGIEAEASELRAVDGNDRVAESVQLVPEDVEDGGEASSIPGVSVAHIRRVRGFA